MSTQNAAGLNEMFHDMNRSCDTQFLRERMVSHVHRSFKSSSTIFWMINENNRLVDPVFKGIQDQYLLPYKDYFFMQNPFDPGNLPALAKPSVLMEQIVPLQDFHKTEYYNDFIKPQNIQRQMAVYIHQNGRLKAVIGMHRTASRGFDAKCLFMGDLISQWATAAFDRLELQQELTRERSIRRLLSNRSDKGVLLFDDTFHCIHANVSAKEACKTIGTKYPFSKGLLQPSPIPDIILDGLKKTGQHQISPGKCIVHISDTQQFQIQWYRIDPNAGDIPGAGYLVMLSRIQTTPDINPARLEMQYNLTPREIEIISHICDGKSNAGIADTLFISEGTVKNHLKNIFAKMSVSNRTQIVHKAILRPSL